MRIFVAINLEPAVRAAVYAAAQPLRDAAPALGWVPESALHLTLKFLGEQPESAVGTIIGAMDAAATRSAQFQTSLAEFGAFPNFRRPQVVWIGMDAEPRLEILHHDVEVACDALGFSINARPFRPHVTLARVKHEVDAAARRALAREARRAERHRFATDVSAVDVMRSTLHADGARHELLHSSPLREL